MAASAILSQPSIAELVREEKWDDVLAKLYAAREVSPRDGDIAEAIRTVRDRVMRSGLERLGAIDAMPTRTGATAALGADEQYVLGLITGSATLDELLDGSTLGRHRTVRALTGLVALGVIRIPAGAPRGAVEAPGAVRHVIVADGHPPSAALTRTMLRLVLGGSTRLETVPGATELAVAAAQEHPDLVVTELRLSGGDGLVALRALRRALGAAVPALVIASKLEIELATGRAPERCALLARPIEKAPLIEALASIGIARRT